MRLQLALPFLATGCFSLPGFDPDAAVSYRDDGTGAAVAGPGFALHFAGGDGFHFPDALEIGGKDVLGHAPAPGCFEENQAGVLISPTPRISADGGAPPITNELSPVLRGPAVVQVKLDWATKLACNPERVPGGTSTFTVFPEGRIVRYDTIADTSASDVSTARCECAPSAGAFTVSTYWTLAREPFADLYLPDRTRDKLAIPAAMEGESNHAVSCVEGEAQHIGFAWSEVGDTTVSGHDAVIGFGRALVVGASNLDNFSYWNTSALLIADSCTSAIERAAAYLEPPPLTINGAPVVASQRDGIYGGDPSDEADPGIELASDRAELTGAMPGAFTVWLRFPRPVGALRATLPGAKGMWYLPQQVDDRSWIVWFRDSISVAQTIVIEPR